MIWELRIFGRAVENLGHDIGSALLVRRVIDYPYHYGVDEVLYNLVGLVDIDNSGELDFKEFLRLMTLFRMEEQMHTKAGYGVRTLETPDSLPW